MAVRIPLLGQQGAKQQMDCTADCCTADLLLVFVWDKTASGTARSNIGNGMEWVNLSKRGGKDGFFRGLAGLL